MGRKGRGREFKVSRLKTEHRWLSGPRRAVGRSMCVCVCLCRSGTTTLQKSLSVIKKIEAI